MLPIFKSVLEAKYALLMILEDCGRYPHQVSSLSHATLDEI